jgi:hypothetical protein
MEQHFSWFSPLITSYLTVLMWRKYIAGISYFPTSCRWGKYIFPLLVRGNYGVFIWTTARREQWGIIAPRVFSRVLLILRLCWRIVMQGQLFRDSYVRIAAVCKNSTLDFCWMTREQSYWDMFEDSCKRTAMWKYFYKIIMFAFNDKMRMRVAVEKYVTK